MAFKKRYFFIPLLISVFAFLFYEIYNEVKEQTIHDYNEQQLLLAKQTSKSIEGLFDNYYQELSYLSLIDHVVTLDKNGMKLLASYYESNKEKIRAVTRVDASGKIIFTYPLHPELINTDISYQEHVKVLLDKKIPVVSDVFNAVQNYQAVAFHSPIIKDGKFHGSLALLIPFDHIAMKFLKDINLQNKRHAWLISQKGILLYDPQSKVNEIGNSIFGQGSENESLTSVAKQMVEGRMGIDTYLSEDFFENQQSKIKMQAVYYPIQLPNTFWSINVATPENEVLSAMTGFRNKLFIIVILLLSIGILITYYFLKAWVLLHESQKRIKAEQDLHLSEKRFRELADLLPQTIFETDKNGKLTFVNKIAFDQFGYDASDLSNGLSTVQMIDPNDQERALENTKRIFNGEKLKASEYKAIRKDGSKFPILVYSSLIIREKKPVGLRGIIIDVSEFKKAEDENRKLLQAVEQSPVSVLITDLNGKIEYVNQQFSKSTGYSSNEIIGHNPSFLKSGEMKNEKYAAVWNTIKNGNVWHGEFHNKRKDGSLFWEEAKISPIFDSSGKTTHYLSLNADITERKLLEEKFLQSQKMEAIGQLAGGIAHDFNNLLTVIAGNSSLMRLNELKKNQEIKLEGIDMAVSRAAALTSQLLAFSRKQISQPKNIDINEIIKDDVKMLSRLITEDINVNLDLDENLPQIVADPHQINQVLLNLMVNARDAIHEKNKIEKSKKLITIKTKFAENKDADKPSVLISISDTGVGIDTEIQSKIFEPFYTTKSLGKGTGLGLSTVYGIVQQNKASININSEPGIGTTFKIYWPISESNLSDSATNESKAIKVPKGNETILLVEDDDNIREITGEFLNKLGYNIHQANSGEKALEIIGKKNIQIDLLVTDIIMAGINGVELSKKVETVFPEVVVIFTSGYSDDLPIEDGFLEKDVNFVQKPFSLNELSVKIRNVLNAEVHH